MVYVPNFVPLEIPGMQTDMRASAPPAVSGPWGVHRTAVADAAYTVLPGDSMICYTTLTATRAVTLPDATLHLYKRLDIKDEAGTGATNHLTFVTSGGQTVDGVATGGDLVTTNYGVKHLYSNGTNWFSC